MILYNDNIIILDHSNFFLIVVIFSEYLNRQAEVCMTISKNIQELELEVTSTKLEIMSLNNKLQFKRGIMMNTINVRKIKQSKGSCFNNE